MFQGVTFGHNARLAALSSSVGPGGQDIGAAEHTGEVTITTCQVVSRVSIQIPLLLDENLIAFGYKMVCYKPIQMRGNTLLYAHRYRTVS